MTRANLFFSLLLVNALLPTPAYSEPEVSADAVAEGRQQSDAPRQKALQQGRVLILCGLSGDNDHHTLFVETVTKLHQGFTQQLQFAPDNVEVLFGDAPQESDSDVIKASRLATREELEKSTAALLAKLKSDDTLWVVVVGHCHFDGKHAWINLPGPDIQEIEFAKLFADTVAGRQIFILTNPTSGFYIKPLSAKGRVVITATEVDWETNETEFPHELARILSSPPQQEEFDIDKDGMITLFDLYITVARNLAQSYVEREFLSTEHALLDDNGDGRGTEVQLDFLTEEQGGRLRVRKPGASSKKSSGDGQSAKGIVIPLVRAEAATKTEE